MWVGAARKMAGVKIAVFGAGGRMGQEICQAVEGADGLELVARIDIGDDPAPAADADVAIDFTVPDAVMANLEWCASHGVHAVVGTTGFTPERLAQVEEWFVDAGCNVIVASNYSIGSLLMMKFAEMAAPFFESVEIIESHHPNKVDAPSGTALATAREIAAARAAAGCAPIPDATQSDPLGARGAVVDGIHVHAVRAAGLVAHEEVVLGNPGETLTIRTNSIDRASFMPGVLLAVRKVRDLPALTVGLDALL